MISSLASALYYMGDVHASKYIIRRKQLSLTFIHDKGQMQFLHNTLMGINREKNRTKNTLSNSGMKKNTTTFDILQNHCNYPTVCLLLDTAHQTNHCITVCGKWLFDYILGSALPLTEASLNYICSGNDTDEITFCWCFECDYISPS